jgi:IS30 family transposase
MLHIPARIDITQRPAVVARRQQIGHWEADTAASVHHSAGTALQVIVERRSRFTRIIKLARKTARHSRRALTRTLSRYPRTVRRSITYDNGAENVEHHRVNHALDTHSYFCRPYHSWEKGTAENTIGLIRRVFPKRTNFDYVSPNKVRRLEHQLNNRPRKCLHYRTPREVFLNGVALKH